MSDVMNLFILSSVALFAVSVLLGLVFLFLAHSRKYKSEASQLLTLSGFSAFLTAFSPFIFCILADADDLSASMRLASALYAAFAGIRLALLGVGALSFLLVRKGPVKRKFLFYASEIFWCILCAALAWLMA